MKKETVKERQQSNVGGKKTEEGMANSSSRPGSGLSGKAIKEDQTVLPDPPR